MTHSIGFIGTGPDPDDPGPGGFAMAYRHAAGYDRLENCELVACADIVPENAHAFAERFEIDESHVYEDYLEMLVDAAPDILSVCTPVPTHAPIVLDCLRTGVPGAIHCEKPMASTWGDARLMAQEAARHEIQLTFNHQSRVSPKWQEAKALVDGGAIGDLERIEVSRGNLFDMGTHAIDRVNLLNDDRTPEWVLGGVDYRRENIKFGAHNENQAIAQWGYGNGVQGLIATGSGEDLVQPRARVFGTTGILEVDPSTDEDVPLRYFASDTNGWVVEEPEEDDLESVARAIEHVVASFETGVESELSARKALSQTEVIFGVYESVRRRGRVDLPLRIEDNPLEAMVESGELTPEPVDGQ